MKVLVVGRNGIGLMPTTPRKARLLLKAGKAEVTQRIPFTIRLTYQTGSAVQDIRLGIDTGECHIGIAVTSNSQVLTAAEVKLRSSMEKRTLMETRKSYRRSRRYRKTRYRHPKFRMKRRRIYIQQPKGKKTNHWQTVGPAVVSERPEGWLPPSIWSKVDHHIRWIRRYQRALPPSLVTTIEVARFDVQRMKDPSIHGELYQRGRLYDYENRKAYILAKFDYTCPVCGHRFDHSHRARLHHVTYRSHGATDNPDEYAPVCEKCHVPENHQPGNILDHLRKLCRRKEYREPAFMNILRRRLWEAFPDAVFTYGNITNADRNSLGWEKSHANDAAVAAMRDTSLQHAGQAEDVLYIRQVRRKKRSLHEANPRKGRRLPNRTAKRNAKNTASVRGFHLYDKVMITETGEIGYISGFTGISAYVIDFEGNYLSLPGKTYRQISLSKLRLVQRQKGNYIFQTA